MIAGQGAFSLPSIILSEVYYDHPGSDAGWEWIELYNQSPHAIDLAYYSIGMGRSSDAGDTTPLGYTRWTAQLEGTISPGGTFVIGGPSSNAKNGNPIYDQVFQFSQIPNPNTGELMGIGLFDVPLSQLTQNTLPVDAVFYGFSGFAGTTYMLDSSGNPGSMNVGVSSVALHINDPYGYSIARTSNAGDWVFLGSNISPSPGVAHANLSVIIPEPTAMAMLFASVSCLIARKKIRRP